MIPKIIHYCWFGGKGLPPLVKKCVRTWKKYLPDYQFILWNEKSFDINSNEWCSQAYAAKKYAFVADYVRLIALYNYGGIYLDTDIKLLKTLNGFLHHEAFMGFERDNILSMGVMGVVKGNKLIAELLDYYNQPFSLEVITKSESNAVVATKYMEEKYNLKRDNSKQIIDGIHVYPKTYFNPMDYWGNWDKSNNTVCVHLYMGSWLPKSEQKKLKFRKTLFFKVTKHLYDTFKVVPFIAKIRAYLSKKSII